MSKIERVFDTTIELKDNAMLRVRPELFHQWNFKLNDEIGVDIYKITNRNSKKVWWNCPVCKSEYDMTVANRRGDNNCSYCAGSKVNHTNSLHTKRSDLISEWMTDKNYPKTPETVHHNTSKRYWWKCKVCNSEYENSVENRVKAIKPCPYCAGKRINHTNSLATLHPHLIAEWHPTKNTKYTPNNIAPNSHEKTWWLGVECGHEWETVTSVRTSMNCGCPYCSNVKLLKGFNDMWTMNPELASLLLNPEDGYENMQRTKKKLDWKCPECDSIIRNKSIDLIHSSGISCPNCSDGVSYPEKFMFHTLQELGIKFIPQHTFSWSEGKTYDFYLIEHNWIIETHGGQHYEENGFHTLGNRDFEDEVLNDIFKKELADDNSVRHTVIDTRESTVEWIMNSIKESDLKELEGLVDVDFNSVAKKSGNSRVIEAWDLWNNGIHSTEEISKIMLSNRSTIRSYLKRGHEIGKCDYTPDIARERRITRTVPVVQLTFEGNFIKLWDGATNAGRAINKHPSGITEVCRKYHGAKTLGGFKWMYKEDYEKEFGKIVSTE